MTLPQPRSIMAGTSRCASRMTDTTLRLKAMSRSSGDISSHFGLPSRTTPPAELTRISMPPKAASAASATALASSSLVKSCRSQSAAADSLFAFDVACGQPRQLCHDHARGRRRIHLLRLTHWWNGQFAVTPDFLPRFHMPEREIYILLGYSGRGLALAPALGAELAAVVAGARPESFPLPVSDIRPIRAHRFWRLGVKTKVWQGRLLDRVGL